MLLERQEDLEALSGAFEDACRSGGQVVSLCGEAGIGKTSVITCFLDGLPERCNVATGFCDPLSTPRPLGPVREVAMQLLEESGAADADTLYFDELLAHVSRSARPLVIVLEDLLSTCIQK